MHFTYEENLDTKNLCQGDLLERTYELNQILERVHTHYAKTEYHYFAVLTQSCDLVRRFDDGSPPPGECKARYITIAAVRTLDDVKHRVIAEQQDALDKKLDVINEKEKSKCDMFFQSLLNNNTPEYFYYWGQPGAIPNKEYCAFLRLSIAIRAEDHYDALLAAKVLQLKESFQHKLGFHVGTLFSRVGTEDWFSGPSGMDRGTFESKASEYININDRPPLWLPTHQYKSVMKVIKALKPDEQTKTRLLHEIMLITKSTNEKRNEVLDVICSAFTDLNCDQDVVDMARQRLLNNPKFRNLVK